MSTVGDRGAGGGVVVVGSVMLSREREIELFADAGRLE
jgi:hypothetical protein